MNSGSPGGKVSREAEDTEQSDVLHSLPRVIITINSLRERNEKRGRCMSCPLKFTARQYSLILYDIKIYGI
jgi:hypothetical protein